MGTGCTDATRQLFRMSYWRVTMELAAARRPAPEPEHHRRCVRTAETTYGKGSGLDIADRTFYRRPPHRSGHTGIVA